MILGQRVESLQSLELNYSTVIFRVKNLQHPNFDPKFQIFRADRRRDQRDGPNESETPFFRRVGKFVQNLAP